MEEYGDMRPLDKLLVALKKHKYEYIANDVSDSLIVIDINGDPHECWDGGYPDHDHVNVAVAMTIDDALIFFSNPLQIADAERMFKANVDKNNDIADLLSENAKLRKQIVRCRDCKHYVDHEWIIATDVSDVCHFWADGVKVEPDGFCKWGERRIDE